MTKIYASMIALACGAFITAGAKTLTPVASINLEKAVANTTLVADDEPKAIAKTFDAKKAMKAKANADAEYIVVGTGYFYDGIFTNSEIEVTVEESASKPGYYRMNPWSVITGEEMPDFYIDCTNPDNCKIPVQDTGMEYLSGYTTEIMSYSAYCESEGITDEEFLEDPDFAPSAITMANNFIQIPEDAILASFPENEEYTEWYFLNSEMYINLPGSGLPVQWGDIAIGSMRDGFFEPMFTGYEIATRDVKVQKNNWIDGKYRILDPWAGLFGENYGGPALYIDASNPDCVVIPYQETGVRVSARGACYILSASSLYETAEEFLASEDAVANITLDENGKIEIKMVPTPLTDGSTIECSPIYTNWPDWSGNENGLYIVRGEDCFIQLPQFSGINKAIVDENAPVEYYNIMGQRIANPAAGQLVIKKQGTAVSKMIVR